MSFGPLLNRAARRHGALVRKQILAVALLLTFTFAGCNPGKQSLATAEQLEREGKTPLALDAYRDQLARTPSRDKKQLSIIQFHIGECLSALDRPNEAFSAYLRAVELDDRNTKAHLRLGELYLQAGEMERSSEHALAVIRSSGASPDALGLVGAAAAANGNTQLAVDAFTRALQMDPGRTKIAIALAEVHESEGRSSEAREVLIKSAEAQPGSSVPWLTLGRIEEQEGKIHAAEGAYRKAVSVEDTPETNLRLAQFLERTARVEEARQVLKKVDDMRPYFAAAQGDFNFQIESTVVASRHYRAALESGAPNPGSPEAAQSRSQLVARLVEADLANASTDAAMTRSSAIRSAQQHLDRYRREIDAATGHLLAAEIALANDDLVQASLSATSALELAPDSAATHYISGIVRYRSSDPAGARAAWDKALQVQPSYVPARLALAEQALRERAYTQAQDYVVPVVRQEPANVRALVLFARVLIATKSYDSAAIITQRVKALAPTAAWANILNGESALAQRKYGSALLEYQQAILLDTQSRDAMDGLIKVYGTGRVDRSMLTRMERIAAAEPVSPTLMEITGRVLARIGHFEDAQRCLKAALQMDPDRRSAAEWLARIQAHRGDLHGATEAATGVSELSPMLNGVGAEQRQDVDSAIRNYEAAVRSGDTTGVAANNLAWIYAQQRTNLDRALMLATRARELQPDNPAVLDTLGFVLLVRREYSRAISALEQAQQLASQRGDPSVLAEVKHHLVEAYLRAGQTERAQLLAQKAASPATK